jgi:hypothetical protein
MKLLGVKVDCYAGGRADETPRRIILSECEHVVTRLLAESVEESPRSKHQTRRFKVLTDQGLVLEVVRLEDGTWNLVL